MLKNEFIKTPILRHFDPDRRCIVEVDSSDWANGGILSQYDNEGILHPVAYFSSRLNPAQVNYEIYDKELLAVVTAFEHWRPELEGTLEPISVITDHKNLEYFMTTKTLNRRQARWSEFLSRFNFVITYRPGKQGIKPDSLTRRLGDLPSNDEDERVQKQQQTILKKHNLDPRIANDSSDITQSPLNNSLQLAPTRIETQEFADTTIEIERLIAEGYEMDTELKEFIKILEGPGPHRSRKLDLSRCSVRNNRLYYDNLIYVPDNIDLKLLLVKNCHNHRSGGHHCRNKLFAHISRNHW